MSADVFDLLRTKCADLSRKRARIVAGISEMQQKMNAVRATYEAFLLEEIADAEKVRAEIKVLTAQNKGLFHDPKSHVFHGIKVGFRKSEATYEVAKKTLALIKELCTTDVINLLIKTKETINKAALKGLDSDTLKQLKVRIVEGADEVIVQPQDDVLEKVSAKVWGGKGAKGAKGAKS